MADFNQQRKRMILAKNPLVSCTPVMAGVKRPDLPPETPFLQSERPELVNRTPIMRRFQVNKEPVKQVNIMGMKI